MNSPAPVEIIPLIAKEFFVGDLKNVSFLDMKSKPTPKVNHAPVVVKTSFAGLFIAFAFNECLGLTFLFPVYSHKWYLELIINELTNLGYKISVNCLNAVDYGVPQNREINCSRA